MSVVVPTDGGKKSSMMSNLLAESVTNDNDKNNTSGTDNDGDSKKAPKDPMMENSTNYTPESNDNGRWPNHPLRHPANNNNKNKLGKTTNTHFHQTTTSQNEQVTANTSNGPLIKQPLSTSNNSDADINGTAPQQAKNSNCTQDTTPSLSEVSKHAMAKNGHNGVPPRHQHHQQQTHHAQTQQPVDSKLAHPKNLYSLVKNTERSTRRRHKQMLMNMFLQTTENTELSDLATSTGAKLLPLASSRKRQRTYRNDLGFDVNQSRPSLFALVPQHLHQIEQQQRQQQQQQQKHSAEGSGQETEFNSRETDVGNSNSSTPINEADIPSKDPNNKDTSKVSLLALEEQVKQRFAQSKLYVKLSKTSQNATTDSSQNENITNDIPNFNPVSLEFNDCSINAITRWAADPNTWDSSSQSGTLYQRKVGDMTPDPRWTVPVKFRRCSSCNLYGHYDVQCTTIGPSTLLNLSKEAKVQTIVQDLIGRHHEPQPIPFTFMGAPPPSSSSPPTSSSSSSSLPTKTTPVVEEQKENVDHATKDKDEDENDTMEDEIKDHLFLGCEVCKLGFEDDKMLICDGCEGFYHMFCLSPPLNSIPDGDWFCSTCEEVHRSYTSDTEIEICGNLVIEQRCRPKKQTTTKAPSPPPSSSTTVASKTTERDKSHWQPTVEMIASHQTSNVATTNKYTTKKLKNGSKLQKDLIATSKGLKTGKIMYQEQSDIDGYTIVATTYSDDLLTSSSNVVTSLPGSIPSDLQQEFIDRGSIVAWFPSNNITSNNSAVPEKQSKHNSNNNYIFQSSSGSARIGVVLGGNLLSKMLFVRPLGDWNEFAAKAEMDQFDISQAKTTSATIWIAKNQLHLVSKSPVVAMSSGDNNDTKKTS